MNEESDYYEDESDFIPPSIEERIDDLEDRVETLESENTSWDLPSIFWLIIIGIVVYIIGSFLINKIIKLFSI